MSPSNRLPEPIATTAQRIPEQGRIRLGVKSGKAMKSIDTLRFTSDDKVAIDAIAALYGGQAKPWRNGNLDQFEVITQATEVPIVLPPDPLGGTPVYELWTRSLQRRCDGRVCTVPERNDDGVEMTEYPCICLARQAMECDPHTRLSVILRDVPFGGTWRLDTKGWNAFRELPGMVGLIERLQASGLAKAYLGVGKQSKVIAGKTQNWVEPYLRLDETPNEIVAGAANYGALGRADTSVPALEAGPTLNDYEATKTEAAAGAANFRLVDPDDDITDAELVDDVSTPLDHRETPPGATTDDAVAAYLGTLPTAQADAIRKRLSSGWVAEVMDDGQVKVVRG